MDEKNVEVVIEAFGNKSLSKNFTVDEIRGKSVEQIVYAIVSQPWHGEDNMTLQMIKSQMSASNGYTPKVCRQEVGQPIRFDPVGKNSPLITYIQDTPDEKNRLLINIIPDHKVGIEYRI